MSIAKLNTGSLPSIGGQKGSSNALLWILALGAVGYGVYHFAIKKDDDGK